MTRAPRRRRDVPGRATVLLFTTGRRISEQRMHRTRTVYVSACRPVDSADGGDMDGIPETASRLRLRARKGNRGRLHRPARSPLGGVVLRPMGDALTVVQVLRTT